MCPLAISEVLDSSGLSSVRQAKLSFCLLLHTIRDPQDGAQMDTSTVSTSIGQSCPRAPQLPPVRSGGELPSSRHNPDQTKRRYNRRYFKYGVILTPEEHDGGAKE